tara:strand:- start:151 stop:879 length:729 start_codon:yes stop_codon:yes gene_type:complete
LTKRSCFKNTTLPSKTRNYQEASLNGSIMQGDSPWGDVPDENQPKFEGDAGSPPQPISISEGFAPMNQGTMLTGTTQMPTGQLIYLQPPSSAAKVVGILVVIYGVLFGVIGSVLSLFGNLQLGNSTLLVFDVVALLIGVATLVGGVMLINYQRRGVMVLLLVIGLSTLVGLGQFTMVDDIYDQMLDEGEITQEEYDALQEVGGIVQGVGMVMVVFCNAICGLFVAIPLMVSNNGLDESKLFG